VLESGEIMLEVYKTTFFLFMRICSYKLSSRTFWCDHLW